MISNTTFHINIKLLLIVLLTLEVELIMDENGIKTNS